ncbi:hypothetical protein Bca52824_048380 [Brassica carinata]|uniref:DUF4283 domain-containing protein n=1 Tax=Brassica carinata TaxID=52824 RepID=A0A8X7RIB2_BRACI|nr:hypothetical protein Bca52824_048380 [Brassica carinata]
MNPPKQDMKVLLFVFPRIWNMEGRVVGTDLGLGRFQFDFEQEEDITEVLKMVPYHFDFWMVSLVRWKPVLEPNYPTKITFWVRVLDIPLQFRAAQIFQSVGEAIGQVQGQVDIVEGRVRVEIDGFKPLVFSMDIEFEEGVEIKEELPGAGVGRSDGEGAQAVSYKAVVAHGSGKLSGERREQTRSQNIRGGDKGKGIAYEKHGSSKQDGPFHPYKGKFTRGVGDGSSLNGRGSGYGDRRRGMQSRGPQPRGVVHRGQQLASVAEGEQQLPDPTKLMFDAFKGVGKYLREEGPIGAEAKPVVGIIKHEGFCLKRLLLGMISFLLEREWSMLEIWASFSRLRASLEEGEELEDWEHGEITDGMEEEEHVGEGVEEGEQAVLEADAGETDVADPGKAPLKKGVKAGNGGAPKKRSGPGFVSPRKKLLAKVAKAGDKGAKKGAVLVIWFVSLLIPWVLPGYGFTFHVVWWMRLPFIQVYFSSNIYFKFDTRHPFKAISWPTWIFCGGGRLCYAVVLRWWLWSSFGSSLMLIFRRQGSSWGYRFVKLLCLHVMCFVVFSNRFLFDAPSTENGFFYGVGGFDDAVYIIS